LADESLANFINSPNPPNFSHSKLSSFTVLTSWTKAISKKPIMRWPKAGVPGLKITFLWSNSKNWG